MDSSTALLGIIVGAILGGAGKILFDYYQRIQCRNAIAAAIGAEISSIINNARLRQLPEHFRNLVPLLRGDAPPPAPWIFFDPSVDPSPVAKAHIDRIGELGPRLAARVVTFYGRQLALRTEIHILDSGVYNAEPLKAAAHIERALALWDTIVPLCDPLIADLFALSGEKPD